jgi:hypothetical protein
MRADSTKSSNSFFMYVKINLLEYYLVVTIKNKNNCERRMLNFSFEKVNVSANRLPQVFDEIDFIFDTNA